MLDRVAHARAQGRAAFRKRTGVDRTMSLRGHALVLLIGFSLFGAGVYLPDATQVQAG